MVDLTREAYAPQSVEAATKYRLYMLGNSRNLANAVQPQQPNVHVQASFNPQEFRPTVTASQETVIQPTTAVDSPQQPNANTYLDTDMIRQEIDASIEAGEQ